MSAAFRTSKTKPPAKSLSAGRVAATHRQCVSAAGGLDMANLPDRASVVTSVIVDHIVDGVRDWAWYGEPSTAMRIKIENAVRGAIDEAVTDAIRERVS
jgi:hypothetical protein